MEGLRLHVYRSSLGDFSNGGLSGRVDQVTLVMCDGEELPHESRVFSPSDRAPAVVLVRRRMGSHIIWHVEPADPTPNGCTPWMAGGAYVATSEDGRIGELLRSKGAGYFYGAFALHDRTETWEHYNALTRD